MGVAVALAGALPFVILARVEAALRRLGVNVGEGVKVSVGVLVDVGGVGYAVAVSMQTLAELPEVGQVLTLRTHLQVREDALTGTLNRRGLDEAFEREATRSDRSKSPICVALLDIDNFKRLNDNLGHQAGDQALKHLSKVIQDALRPSDSGRLSDGSWGSAPLSRFRQDPP